jgi:N-acyl homoserine lactone hydrolase
MGNCDIYPIPLVEYISDKSTSTARCNIGQKITKICYAWYIEGSSHNILVDTGSIAANYHKRFVSSAKDIQTIDDGLKSIGRRVEDIEYVILTHLHPDHVALASRFGNATFFVQQKEYEVGLKPHPSIEWYYIREYFENLNVRLIEGDVEVAKNVSVLSTPGHSSGGQSVKVNSGKGNVVISGICGIYENFFPPEEKYPGKEVLIPGLYLNQFEVFDSLLKIKRNADIVIANHDNRYKEISRISA